MKRSSPRAPHRRPDPARARGADARRRCAIRACAGHASPASRCRATSRMPRSSSPTSPVATRPRARVAALQRTAGFLRSGARAPARPLLGPAAALRLRRLDRARHAAVAADRRRGRRRPQARLGMTAASPARAPRRRVDGVLLLDKPAGLSSNARAAARRSASTRPRRPATPGRSIRSPRACCRSRFGEATKFAQFLLDARKRYLATLRLGATTTTGDTEGEVVATAPVAFGADELAAALRRLPRPHRGRFRPRTPRSSSRAAPTTTTPARASRFRGTRARSRSTSLDARRLVAARCA